MLNLYRVCGHRLASNISLPELPPADSGPADFTFELSPASAPCSAHWMHHWRDREGTVCISVAKSAGEYRLRFSGADFVMSDECRAIRCQPHGEVGARYVRHLLLDQVLPFALSGRGLMVFHGSAVQIGESAAAFLGLSGSGKSTLACGFARAGWPVLTDDCVLVRLRDAVPCTVPAYPGLRLWPDSARALAAPLAGEAVMEGKTKTRVAALHAQAESLPLRSLFVLERVAQDQPRQITALSARALFEQLYANAFRLDLADREKLRAEFAAVTALAGSVRGWRLRYPADFSSLPAVVDEVVKLVSHG